MKKIIFKVVFVCISMLTIISVKNIVKADTIQIGSECIQVTDDVLQDPEYYKYYGTDEQKEMYRSPDENSIDEFKSEKTLYGNSRKENAVLGCDVSEYQGEIDWKKAKAAGINFAFIRVGKRGLSDGIIREDKNFKKNIEGAIKQGIRVGCYIFSEAITDQEAVEEADYLLQRVSGYNITMPLVIDYEGFNENHRIYNAHLSKEQMTDIVSSFCDKIKSSGYSPAVYGSASYFVTYMDGQSLGENNQIWMAAYSKSPEYYSNTTYDYWQYTDTADGTAYGMQSKGLDLDYCYNWSGMCNVGNNSIKYYNAGKPDLGYNGFNTYGGEWYIMKNGAVDTSFTGLHYYNHDWWYVKNGKVDFNATTLCQYNGVWWYVKNGKVDFGANTLCKYYDTWWYVKQGKVDKSANTVYKYNGTWWYIHNGYVDFSAKTLCKYNGTWWYIDKGRIDWNSVTVVKFGETWYYVHNGRLNWNDNGLCYYNGRWWYINNGRVDFSSVTVQRYNGTWWYVHDGYVDFSARTLCKYSGTWWFINNGQISWKERTLVNYYGTWYFVNNGKLDWNYTGTCEYEGYIYAVKQGRVDRSVPRRKNSDWVSNLKIAKSASQLIVVQAEGTYADVSMHYRDADGIWSCIASTTGRIGKNGIGKTCEGDKKTPTGVYSFIKAFGNSPDPGCAISYTHCDSTYYWVDDSNSKYYNQFVTTRNVNKDWRSAEHISAVGASYNYVLALDYNKQNKKGAGSAIFLHCGKNSTAGCIAVPEEIMREIMRNVHDDCYIVIDSKQNIEKY